MTPAERDRFLALAKEDWQIIPEHPGDLLPEVFLVAYENGHVTSCEFSECSVGGPDDHETFHPHIAPSDDKGRMLADYECRPWLWRCMPSAATDLENLVRDMEAGDRSPNDTAQNVER